jgi:SAM-dependent methyltransferase
MSSSDLLAEQCGLSAATDEPAGRLLVEILRRRTWSLHRHVHLVAAFEQVHAETPLSSVVSVGCGAGLSELFLAARHPEVRFTLTDFDASRLEGAEARMTALELSNVSFETLDLLAEPSGPTYDLVTSIEVLEHIDDDGLAARHLARLTHDHLWILVPFCRESALTNPASLQRAWEKFEHHRPGYTFETLGRLVEGSDVRWMRNCYRPPDALTLRQRLSQATDDELRRDRDELIRSALEDVGDDHRQDKSGGIEVLARRRPVDGAGAVS